MKSLFFALTLILSTQAFAADYVLDSRSIQLDSLTSSDTSLVDAQITVERNSNTPSKVVLKFDSNSAVVDCVKKDWDPYNCAKFDEIRSVKANELNLDFTKAAKLSKGESEVFLIKINQRSRKSSILSREFKYAGEVVSTSSDYDIRERSLFGNKRIKFTAK